MTEHLAGLVSSTPLERMATLLQKNGLTGPAGRLFDSYNEFLVMLDDETIRKRLEKLAPEAAATDEAYQAARVIGHSFQDALDEVFFGAESPFRDLTLKYGVF